MLDVHVLLRNETPDDYVVRCLSSITYAEEQTYMPINIHVVDEPELQGSFPYVTWVQDSDWLEDTAFEVLAPYLVRGEPCVRTGNRNVFQNKKGLLVGSSFDSNGLLVVKRHTEADALQIENKVYNRRITNRTANGMG